MSIYNAKTKLLTICGHSRAHGTFCKSMGVSPSVEAKSELGYSYSASLKYHLEFQLEKLFLLFCLELLHSVAVKMVACCISEGAEVQQLMSHPYIHRA